MEITDIAEMQGLVSVRCLIGEIEKRKPFPQLTTALDGLRNAECKPAALSNGGRDTPWRLRAAPWLCLRHIMC